MKRRKTYDEYEITIYWDDKDRIFVAEVPELAGCAAHGESRAEAMLNAEVAIANWIKVAREIGHGIPKPRKRSLVA